MSIRVILLVFLFSFFNFFSGFTSVFSSGFSTASAALVEAVNAIVNKKAIYKSDIDRFRKLTPLRIKVDPLFLNHPLSRSVNPSDYEITEFLVDELITVEKYPVTEAEAEQEVVSIQSNLHITREALRSALDREGFQFEDYFQLMRVSLSKRQLLDREIRSKAAVSEDDLKAEYNRQRAGSKSFMGSFHLYLLKFSKAFYKTPQIAKEEAEKALQEIEKGTPFETVAQSLGDETGGDLDYLSYSEMSPALQKEVQKIGPGKTSKVFEEGNDYRIVKISDIRADEDKAYDKEKELLRSKLLESEFQHQIQLWHQRQRSLNYVRINVKSS